MKEKIYELNNRKLATNNMWLTLLNTIQMDSLYCILNDDVYTDCFTNEIKQRDNGLIATTNGGFQCIVNNQIIFEISPYYWGECTCGNDKLEENRLRKLRKDIFTNKEWIVFNQTEEWCDIYCPANENNSKNKVMSLEEMLDKCTCGMVHRNIEIRKQKSQMRDKIEKYNKECLSGVIGHLESCLLQKHNFIYMPNTKQEFWIDWYKYPFRCATMNKPMTEKEIVDIFALCTEYVRKTLK